MLSSLAIFLTAFRVVVIPAQFQDCPLTSSREEISAMLDGVSAYFDEQFRGADSFSFELAPTVTLSKNTAWYGKNSVGIHDKNVYEAVVEACQSSAEEIDFSLYDSDEDGEVECVVLLTAGQSEACATDEDNIWPQQSSLSAHKSELTLSGKIIDNYIITPELWSNAGDGARLTGIGELCHEFGHILGLPDYYDTDGEASGGNSPAMWGSTALMDKGNLNDEGRTPPNFNALDLDILGIGAPEPLTTGTYRLEPVNKNGRYFKAETGRDGEFFLFEARDNIGRDAFIGGAGLLVYHIDRTAPFYKELWDYNQVNCFPEHQCAYIVSANKDATDASGAFFPWGSVSNLTSATEPSFTFWDGNGSALSLTDIKRHNDGSVSFSVIEAIKITGSTAFQNAVLVSWQLDPSLKGAEVSVKWCGADGTCKESKVSGTSHCLIEGLLPGTDYDITLAAANSRGIGFSVSTRISTRVILENTMPYIHLGSASRHEDGSFVNGTGIALRIFNGNDINDVKWYFNGQPVKTGDDGRFVPRRSGELRAVITHLDGTTSIILKQINIR